MKMFESILFVAMGLAILLNGCAGNEVPLTDVATVDSEQSPTAESKESATAAAVDLPQITAAALDQAVLPRYESLEMVVDLEAAYDNPYDAREVTLDGTFIAPDGSEMAVPGFWDGEEAWRVRFTPSQEGEWQYQLTVADGRGVSQPFKGSFTAALSNEHGWLQIGDQVNPDYSGRYLVHHDGAPFYGLGHGDALNILVDGFDIDEGVGLFDNMKNAGENYVVWWPLYTNSPLSTSYDDYSTSNSNMIDLVVRDAQEEGIYLIFTVWNHRELRDENHEWNDGKWSGNGFNDLVEIDEFFTSEEAWLWQENFYRYIIARWGYSPAIGMWQTVSEINGTNAYDQANPWHQKVNSYFVDNDPYRHPTTASMSGDVAWPEGHKEMDAPQVHVYDFEDDAVKAAEIIADWTQLMWDGEEKPNWVGEFGIGGNTYYPELFHNAIWAALASGAAMTPAEWNGGSFWGRMTPEMNADMVRLAQFVDGMPLAAWDPVPLQLSSDDPQVRGWGIAGAEGGLFWVQDFAMEGSAIEDVRENSSLREDVKLEIEGMVEGSYTILPYDPWLGVYLKGIELVCVDSQACAVTLPDFQSDMAFKIERK